MKGEVIVSQYNGLGKLKEKRKKRSLRYFVIIVLLLLIVGGGSGYFYIQHLISPVDSSNHKRIMVNIPSGSSVTTIGQILEKNGLVQQALAFKLYAKWHHESGFRAGTYAFSPSMTMQEMMKDLEEGKQSPSVIIGIPEGYWVKDVAAAIARKTNLKKADILKKMKDRQYIKTHFIKRYWFLSKAILNPKIIYPLEGYLFPATYNFYKTNPTLDDIINKMLAKTGEILKKHQQEINKSPLKTVHKVMTMASLLQGEASTTDARKKIAGVFYNRLKQGMPLQTDPTIAYAEQRHLFKTYYKDLKIKSPYNTYTNKGLPVGPINNPAESAITAVLNPTKTDAIYFFARSNGKIIYSKTYQEHQTAVSKYQK